jgi:hypothetical protein
MTLNKTRELLEYTSLSEAECEETVELSEHMRHLAEKSGVTEFQLMIASVTIVMGMVNRQNDPNERGMMVQEVFEHMWEAAGLPRT